MPALRRLPAVVLAGDRRVWRAAAIATIPFVALTAFYCLRPRFYYTGTDSVEDLGAVTEARAGVPVCVPGLIVPAGTAGVRVQVFASGSQRPAMQLLLHAGGRTVRSTLPPAPAEPSKPTNADFAIPEIGAHDGRDASLCLTAAAPVGIGGTSLEVPPHESAPTAAGAALAAKIAVWYLPRPGARSSYVARLGAILSRAALFRPGVVGAWTYAVLLFVVLPALALLALRTLALAVAGGARRLGLTLFALAALNACCWALITPVFQGPDEVDHFAYTQSLVERGARPSANAASPLPRWSDAETLALERTGFVTDHQVGDTRAPWLRAQADEYSALVRKLHPSKADGGGYTTSAVHGPFYYLALAPAYAATSGGSIFSQLTVMRFCSALLGALVVLFAYLLARELAPRRAWLAVLAALLVAYEPMYGFISGIVNNDVGVNATAAALELLLIRALRRGVTIPSGLLTGAVLLLLPNVKGTGLSLYPVAALVGCVVLWRHHSRRDLAGWAALALGAVVVAVLATHVVDPPLAPTTAGGTGTIGSNASAVDEALHHIPDYLSYVWQAFLPRLPFMTQHFPSAAGYPGYVIFVKRGWAAFGWYDVFFPAWVYVAILATSVATLLLAPWAARREWPWLSAHWAEALAVLLMPIAVIAGFLGAYYTPGSRPTIAEFGRYAFPAIAPIALLVVGALHAFGRRAMVGAGVVLLVAVIALSYAGQLLTLSSFYA